MKLGRKAVAQHYDGCDLDFLHVRTDLRGDGSLRDGDDALCDDDGCEIEIPGTENREAVE